MAKQKERYWADCSKEEKAAVRNWNKKKKKTKDDYAKGIITYKQLIRRFGKLAKELDEIEKKYENDCPDRKYKKLF